MFDDWKVPVVRVRTGVAGEDQYGDPIPGGEERSDLPPALFAPTGTDLPVAAGVDATITNPVVYWPDDWPDVRASDVLVIDGDEWRVDGRPQSWPLGLAVKLTGTESTREVTE